MLKIESGLIKDFFDKVRMSGGQQIREGLFDFTSEGLKVAVNSETKQARCVGLLKKAAFVEYEAIGKVGLNDLDNVRKVMERFGGEMIIERSGHLLTMKNKTDKKRVEIELVDERFLTTDITEPNLEFDETFTATSTEMKDIFNDVQINKDSVMTIETEAKVVNFFNTGKYKFKNQILCDTVKGGTKVNFGAPLIDSINKLDGKLEISIKKDYPAKIREITEHSVITIIVAPRVEEE